MRLIRRLAYLFRFRRNGAELREELEFHRNLHEQAGLARGLSSADARDAARRAMGNETFMREEARSVWLRPWLEAVWTNTAYALRGLRRNPVFALGITLTLTLGIGANAAMFSLIDRLLFRPPALMANPGSVHRAFLLKTVRGAERAQFLSYATYADISRWATGFSQIAAFSSQRLRLTVGGMSRTMPVGAVSAGFFRFFDAPPRLGRYFTEAEDAPPEGAFVAVLSSGTWTSQFGSREDVLGSTVRIDEVPYTIIGVAPDGFTGLWPYQPPAAYIPVATYGARDGGRAWETNYDQSFNLRMIVRRGPGMPVDAATAALTEAFRRSYQAQLDVNPRMAPVADFRPRALATPILSDRGPVQSTTARMATWISGVTLIVLLIACANVASLLLARIVGRRREVAVRLALGAGRERLFAQLFTEGVVIAAIGGVGGLVAAIWGGALLQATFLPGTAPVPVLTDTRTLLFVSAIVLGVGLVSGFVQILQAGRASLNEDLKSGVRDGTYQRVRLRSVLLTVQCALSVLLLVGAGLFIRSLTNVRHVRLGFNADPVLIVELNNMNSARLDSAATVALRLRLLEAAKSVPGVSHATFQRATPFAGSSSYPIAVAGIDSARALGVFYFNSVSPEYFATMSTRILRGRGIDASDVDGAERVMVIGESMGKVLWPGEDPIGRCVRVGIPPEAAPCRTVVGIAENIRAQSFDDDPRSFLYYMPAAQWKPHEGGLFVRAQGEASQFLEPVRKRLQSEMPGDSFVAVTRLADVLDGRMRSWALGAKVFSAFGALALVLAAVGLYSSIAYNVEQRRHELGVRLALGASRNRVVRLMVGEGLRFAIPGVAIGCGLALWAGRWVRPLLFRESPYDPAVFATVTIALLSVAAAASWVPAMRAGRLDPKEVLQAN